MFDFCKLILYPGILLNFLLFVLVFSLILLDFPGITCKGIALLPPCTVLMLHLSGFPGGAVVENLPANAGDTGSSPGLGRSHMPWSN